MNLGLRMTLLTEQDIADIRADIRMAEQALAQHLDREPLPHMVEEHRTRTEASRRAIARLKGMLA